MTIEIKQVDINLIACLDMLGWLFEDGRPNPDAAKIVATQREQFEARIAELERERDAAIKVSGEWSRKAGAAQGRLEASEMAGVVDGWQQRATTAEARLAEAVEVIRPFSKLGDPVCLPGGTIELRGTWAAHDVSIKMIYRAARFIQETERG